MQRFLTIRKTLKLAAVGVLAAAGVVAISGCETQSFLDPSVTGSHNATARVQPILDRLSVIESGSAYDLPTSQVMEGDLKPDVREYVLGPGDIITVTIYELRIPGVDDIQTLRVSETGEIRLAVVGSVAASGRSPSQLEDDIRNKLEEDGILRDATVGVIVQQSQQNTYSVFAQSAQGSTRAGTYLIPKPDFRLVEAITLANGIPGRTKRIYVIRQAALSPAVTGDREADDGEGPQRPAPVDPLELLEGLEGGLDDAGPDAGADRNAPPAGVEAGLDSGGGAQWVFVDGKWVRVAAPAGDDADAEEARLAALSGLVTQRIIEIPYDRLKAGDMRYNIVIRPGDIISIPSPNAGFVYIEGAINRPGAYTVPGEQELTLRRLIPSAGGLSTIAWPERVEIIRQTGPYEQAIVRLNYRAIADGTEPDIYLKANDVINIGTNGVAVPLAVFRNGLRATYGFGFVLDRNFNNDVFPGPGG
ncbi:polysaccharide biosynthesis/export family protein [Phycisphaeraceae bacterium D3-23]